MLEIDCIEQELIMLKDLHDYDKLTQQILFNILVNLNKLENRIKTIKRGIKINNIEYYMDQINIKNNLIEELRERIDFLEDELNKTGDKVNLFYGKLKR